VSAGRRFSAFVRARAREAGAVASVLRTAHADPVVQGTPLVSVVLSTYNWSSVLRHSVRSVLWQTYPHLELLVIGDGCTDDSEEVVASFGDDRVRWHNLETNSGSQAIPNGVGLELARGQYVAYQGHDDVWHPKHLAALLAGLQETGADLAYSLAEVLGPPGSRLRGLTGVAPPDHLPPGIWLPPTSIAHASQLGRRIGGWRTWEEAHGPPDRDFVIRAREAGARIVRVRQLTTFKFTSSDRKNAYREKPSHEQEACMRRIESERVFIEREVAGLVGRRLSPLKKRLEREEPTEAERKDPEAFRLWLRRVRGLD
jgi:glycosyltransferase involved in cell wall biosynthesis